MQRMTKRARRIGSLAALFFLTTGIARGEDTKPGPLVKDVEFDCDSPGEVFNRVVVSANDRIYINLKAVRTYEQNPFAGAFLLLTDATGKSETLSILSEPLSVDGTVMPLNSKGGSRHILLFSKGDLLDGGPDRQPAKPVKDGTSDVDLSLGDVGIEYKPGLLSVSRKAFMFGGTKKVDIPTSLGGIRKVAISCQGGEYLISTLRPE